MAHDHRGIRLLSIESFRIIEFAVNVEFSVFAPADHRGESVTCLGITFFNGRICSLFCESHRQTAHAECQRQNQHE